MSKKKLVVSSVSGSSFSAGEDSPLLINQTAKELSPDAILNYIGLGPFQVLAILLSGLTYFASGCDSSIFMYIEDNVREKWNVSTSMYAILPALTAPPNIVGAVITSLLVDRFGRWWPYALCMSWMGVFSIASAFASSFPLLIGLRCLTSFAIGGIAGLAYPTVIEFLPVKSRGSVVVLNSFMDGLGGCLSCGLAWWLIPTYQGNGWRFYILASAIPVLLVALFRLVFYIESPRYLIAHGKYKKAWKIFEIIAKVNGKKLSGLTSCDGTCLMGSAQDDKGNKVKKQPSIFLQALQIFSPRYLKWTLPISLIMITQSFGFLSATLFLPDFLKKVSVNRYFTIMMIMIARIPGNLLLCIIIEWPKVRRLNSLRFFTSLAVVFYVLLTFIQTSLSVPLFLVFIYFSVGPIRGLMYTYISELYPTSIRSVTISFFYILEATTFMCGSFAGSKAANVSQNWIFPAVFSIVFFVQLCLSFTLHYEPGGKELKDNVE